MQGDQADVAHGALQMKKYSPPLDDNLWEEDLESSKHTRSNNNSNTSNPRRATSTEKGLMLRQLPIQCPLVFIYPMKFL